VFDAIRVNKVTCITPRFGRGKQDGESRTAFLEDFQQHWPIDDDVHVDFIREGVCGNAGTRAGKATWRRVTEVRARGAKSVFHFDVQGSVAKSTHSGLLAAFISGTSMAGKFRLADLR
jgi:hypothetical protein